MNPFPAVHPRRQGRWLGALSAAALAGAALMGVPTASAAATGSLVGAGSSRCLDVNGASQTAGTALQIWDCNGGGNQRWATTTADELRTYNGTMCLALQNNQTAAGTRTEIANCTGGQNQKWRLNDNGSVTGLQSGLCLDVSGAATANGAAVVLWNCNGQSNQKWAFNGEGGGDCNVATVDPNATPQARRLLCYVHSQYGNHILSGQQETNGSENEFDFIYNNTGKRPAIRGLDMCDRPGAVDRAAAWWNAGGIPMIGWHVGAPATSRCNYGGTASINNTLTPGTREYASYTAELDEAASQLQRLQSQGVAVLWRPYHEAGGTWFWWSKEGGAQYQRLWKFQFNYLVNVKGIHNLVWLWPANGSPDSSFYPGKSYVDIGGADTYVNDRGPLTSLFNSTRNIVGSTIPIALHENGAIPDPARLQSTATRWVTFCTWNGSWITGQDPGYLRTTFTSPYVVTRDEVPNLR